MPYTLNMMPADMGRRSFMKMVGLAGAGAALGNLAMPSRLEAAVQRQFNFDVPELEGTRYSNQLVEVFNSTGELLSSGITTDSRTSIISTGIEELVRAEESASVSDLSAFYNGNTNIIQLPLGRKTTGHVRLYNILGQEVARDLGTRELHEGRYQLPLNQGELAGLARENYILDIQTPQGRIAMVVGVTRDGRIVSHSRKPYISPQLLPQSLRQSVAGGRLGKNAAEGDEQYKVVVTDNDPNKRHYKRTFTFTPDGGVIQNVENKVVGYVQQEGVTPEMLPAFMKEGNTWGDNGAGGTPGIIKFYDEGNGMKYIIMRKSPFGSQYDFTTQDQSFIKQLIEQEIFNKLGFTIPIELKDESYTLPDVSNRRGAIHIMGDRTFGVATGVENNTIVSGDSLLKAGYVNNGFVDQIIAEAVSPIYMPSEIENSVPKQVSLLHRGSQLPGLQPIDIKAYRIAQHFKGEHIDNVLGFDSSAPKLGYNPSAGSRKAA